MPKRFLYVFQSSPYGGFQAQEGLDALLACSIFDQSASVLFVGDGVYQLLAKQNPIAQKSVQKQLQSLSMYDIDKIFVCEFSLNSHNLEYKDLNLTPIVVTQNEMNDLIRQQDHILSF